MEKKSNPEKEIETKKELDPLKTPFVTKFVTRNLAPFFIVIVDGNMDSVKYKECKWGVNHCVMLGQNPPSFLDSKVIEAKKISEDDRRILLKYLVLPSAGIIPHTQAFRSDSTMMTDNFGPHGLMIQLQKSQFKMTGKMHTQLWLADNGRAHGLAIIDPLSIDETKRVELLDYRLTDKVDFTFTEYTKPPTHEAVQTLALAAKTLIAKYGLEADFKPDSARRHDDRMYSATMKRVSFNWDFHRSSELGPGSGVWKNEEATIPIVPIKWSAHRKQVKQVRDKITAEIKVQETKETKVENNKDPDHKHVDDQEQDPENQVFDEEPEIDDIKNWFLMQLSQVQSTLDAKLEQVIQTQNKQTTLLNQYLSQKRKLSTLGLGGSQALRKSVPSSGSGSEPPLKRQRTQV